VFYYINKVVGWILSPLGIFFLGAVLGWVLTRNGKRGVRRLGIVLVVFSATFLWLMATPLVNGFLGLTLEERTGCSCGADIARLPKAEAIVLLGGGVGRHDKCGLPELCQSADRVWVAADIWKAGKAPVVTLSGGGVRESTVPFLKALGVDEGALAFFPDARNTEEEARAIADSLKRADDARPKVLLVTSAWHMRRAKRLFGRAGLDVIPCAADWEMHLAAEAPLKFADFFPSADALYRNSCAFKEWVALVGYSLRR